MSQWIAVATTDARPPTNGKGGASAAAISTFTAATIFGAGIITAGTRPAGAFVASLQANNLLTGWAGGLANAAIGDIIFDNQGGVLLAWGKITKLTLAMFTTAAGVFDVIEVDRWRKPGVINSNITPTDGDDLGLWHGVYATGEKWVIDWIDFTGNNQVTAQPLTICDLAQVAIPGLTFQNQAQIATNLVYQPCLHLFTSGHHPNGTTSIELDQPFTVKTGNAGATATVGFRVLAP